MYITNIKIQFSIVFLLYLRLDNARVFDSEYYE